MCGIVGIIGAPDAAREAVLGLTTLQHRGQDGAGILTYDEQGFHLVRDLGLVDHVFQKKHLETLTGSLAIAHTRYSTVGRGDVGDIQPFVINFPFGIGIAHNGNIVNTHELAHDLKTKHRRQLLTRSDTEVLLNLLAVELSQGNGEHFDFDVLCKAIKPIFDRVNGSYSIVALVADQGLVAFRDPHGIRPLILGRREGSVMIASEEAALAINGYEAERDLKPGEVIWVDMNNTIHSRVLTKKEHRPCMFEWVYFASPESVIDGTPVYRSRLELGRALGKQVAERMKKEGFGADIVVPIPETSRIAAIALSEELGIPYRELLIKNRYVQRTFILDSAEKRRRAVSLKLSPVRSEIAGKRVILVDDSIVRGTTSRKLVELVREAGASEVIFVSTCPPIRHPCFYGIDFPNREELIAHDRSLAEIASELRADHLIYLDVKGLETALHEAGDQPVRPCMACLTGEYPTAVSSGEGAGAEFALRRSRDQAGVGE